MDDAGVFVLSDDLALVQTVDFFAPIVDEELKYGLAVTGRADPRRLLTNAGARVGDRLILTKPIGTALLATVAKNGLLPDAELRALVDSMRALNAAAGKAALAVGATCATDVTGFGLLGHASHIAKASRVTLRIFVNRVPLLPGARQAADRGVRTGGAERNLEYLEPRVDWGKSSQTDRVLMIDPQTSGGLLLALSSDRVSRYLSLVPDAIEIGEVIPAGASGLVLA